MVRRVASFETHQSQCCVLGQDTLSAQCLVMVQHRKTENRPNMSKIIDKDVKHQHTNKQNKST